MGTTAKTHPGKLRQLGKYELIARIAAGGMAEVFLARQLGMMNFQKVVVVKLIHPHLSQEKQFVDMFLDEARISALIKHHNVVDIYDLGLDGDTYFIAMEYIAGQALSRVISHGSKGKPLDVLTTAKIIADSATGLEAAHNLTSITGEHLELVHRDVSPGNILVSYAGAVKLVDFGVSQSLSQLKTASEDTQLKGKIGYASPEQLEEAPLDHRSDLFSLGVVLWEALTLNRLYRAESPGATVRKILAGNPPPPSQLRPEVPADLDRITLKALSLRPEERYQSAVEMRDDLFALLDEANYRRDERVVADYMASEFSQQRKTEEALLRQVVAADEEIEVGLGPAEHSFVASSDAVPRPASTHDLDLDAEIVIADIAVAEPEIAVAEPDIAKPNLFPSSAAIPVAIGDTSIKNKRGVLYLALAAAAALALAIIAVAIVGSGAPAERASKPKTQATKAPALAAPVPLAADAGVSAEMVGVPPLSDGPPASAAELALQEARALYLGGWQLFSAGDGSRARVKYRAALRKVAGFPPALRGLGISYAKENRRSKARYHLGKYLEAAPSASDASEIRALLLQFTESD